MLYPIKFYPIFKEKIWGGTKLQTILNKKTNSDKTGESWEISCVKNNISIVCNGHLKGLNIIELLEKYKSDLVGEKVYKHFGNFFPLLIKFIDAKDDLSVQVHPDDEYAKQKHNENGKTELWYIVDADKNTDMIIGVTKSLTKNEFLKCVKENKVKDILNFEKIREGDAFYIPAGRIHAIMNGTLLAEIQQNSDLTYRIYDWERKGLDGKYRKLHTEAASEVVNLNKEENYFIDYKKNTQNFENLSSCNHFTVNILQFENNVYKEYSEIDSFVIYMCIKGSLTLKCANIDTIIHKGETVLVPAKIKQVEINPNGKAQLLEIYIK